MKKLHIICWAIVLSIVLGSSAFAAQAQPATSTSRVSPDFVEGIFAVHSWHSAGQERVYGPSVSLDLTDIRGYWMTNRVDRNRGRGDRGSMPSNQILGLEGDTEVFQPSDGQTSRELRLYVEPKYIIGVGPRGGLSLGTWEGVSIFTFDRNDGSKEEAAVRWRVTIIREGDTKRVHDPLP